MRNMMIAAFTAILISAASEANAQSSKTTLTGADFLSACTRADMDWINFCNGYVQAVVDGVVRPEDICLPAGTTRAKLVGVVVEQLMASPDLLKLNAASAVNSVLQKAYRCQ